MGIIYQSRSEREEKQMELDRSYFNSIRLNTHRGKFYDVEAVDRLLVDIRSRADALNKEVYSSREKLAEAEKTAEALREENNELFLKGQALSQEILALREELRAAQAGEASLIPEKEEEEPILPEGQAEETPSWEESEEFYFLTEELPEPRKHGDVIREKESEQRIEEPSEEIHAEEEAPSHLQEEAEREAAEILSRAEAERDRILNEARFERQKTVERMERVFAMLKEISTYAIEKSERVHEEFLRAVAGEESTPEDLSEKVGKIAAELSDMEEE